MKKIVPIFLALFAFAGCGVSHNANHNVSLASKACSPTHTAFAHMGLCVGKRFSLLNRRPVKATFSQGLDVSLYQGLPDWGTAHEHGVKFVWNQSSDGFGTDWNFVTNWCREKAHGIVPGAYIFERPGSGYSEGRFLAQRILSARSTCGGGSEVPPLLDAEVNGAYEVTASAAQGVRSVLGNVPVATYTSPGLWAGCCRDSTFLDAAIWGGPGYTFGGWPYYIARQYCGTCNFPGVGGEVDLQSDHGVLNLIKPPSPPCDAACQRSRKHNELRAHQATLKGLEGRQKALRRVLSSFGCRRRQQHHESLGPRCKRWFKEGDSVGIRGRGELRVIHQLHREGIF